MIEMQEDDPGRMMKTALEAVLGIALDDWAKCVEMEIDKIRVRLDSLEVANAKRESGTTA